MPFCHTAFNTSLRSASQEQEELLLAPNTACRSVLDSCFMPFSSLEGSFAPAFPARDASRLGHWLPPQPRRASGSLCPSSAPAGHAKTPWPREPAHSVVHLRLAFPIVLHKTALNFNGFQWFCMVFDGFRALQRSVTSLLGLFSVARLKLPYELAHPCRASDELCTKKPRWAALTLHRIHPRPTRRVLRASG